MQRNNGGSRRGGSSDEGVAHRKPRDQPRNRIGYVRRELNRVENRGWCSTKLPVASGRGHVVSAGHPRRRRNGSRGCDNTACCSGPRRDGDTRRRCPRNMRLGN
eukprot:Gregarina_sp_Poly_1__10172@NODE_69_length_16257_cov_66_887276_g59_i0_p15_GENE_NODE_69_length_16257_cov_66_887276_g59_i0NODE_69_length_16257_cov_66_887276_g59_i0_p15_ORF_typecomplete_len104_score5_13DUF1876/PF08962_11/0_46DUF1876/PF08962_11/1_5e03_NODE_69_length_16257_cov_66_887276_g59_i01023910550